MTPTVRLRSLALRPRPLKQRGQAADAAVGAAAHRAGPLDVMHGPVQAGKLYNAPPDCRRLIPETSSTDRRWPVAPWSITVRVAGVEILAAVGLRVSDGSFLTSASGRQQPGLEL